MMAAVGISILDSGAKLGKREIGREGGGRVGIKARSKGGSEGDGEAAK